MTKGRRKKRRRRRGTAWGGLAPPGRPPRRLMFSFPENPWMRRGLALFGAGVAAFVVLYVRSPLS